MVQEWDDVMSNVDAQRENRKKIFISWSGTQSHGLANKLKSYLPHIIHNIEPFLSSDMDKGHAWQSVLQSELSSASLGILCVTKENLTAPWLLFEAGALFKSIGAEAKRRVIPLLFDVKYGDIDDSPLSMLQACVYNRNGNIEENREDFYKLALSIYTNTGGTDMEFFRTDFDMYYPEIKKEFNKISDSYSTNYDTQRSEEQDFRSSAVLDMILKNINENQRSLSHIATIVEELPNGLGNLTDRMKSMNDELLIDAANRVRQSEDVTLQVLDNKSAEEMNRALELFEVGPFTELGPRYQLLCTSSLLRDRHPWTYVLTLDLFYKLERIDSTEETEKLVNDYLYVLDELAKTLLRDQHNQDIEHMREVYRLLSRYANRLLG